MIYVQTYFFIGFLVVLLDYALSYEDIEEESVFLIIFGVVRFKALSLDIVCPPMRCYSRDCYSGTLIH